jgi:hypothetical protein
MDSAKDFLLANVSLDQINQNLAREIASLTGLVSALKQDKEAAEAANQAELTGEKMLSKQLASLEQRVNDARTALQAARLSIQGNNAMVILGLELIATTALGIATAGANVWVVAAVPTLISIGQDLLADTQFDLIADPAERKRLVDSADGLEIGTKGGVALLSIPRMLNEIVSGTLNQPSEEPLRQLVRETMETAHALLLARHRVTQTTAALAAAGIRLTQAQADLAAAQQQVGKLTLDVTLLERTGRWILSAALKQADLLMGYSFQAARALEIYALKDASDKIRFDYGYVHPDVERDHDEKYISTTALLSAYQTSWAAATADILSFGSEYRTYLSGGTQVDDAVFTSISDPGVIQTFKTSMTLPIPINLSALVNRNEARVEYVHLSFVGATAAQPFMSILVEHGGTGSTRLRDGSIVQEALHPRPVVVVAARNPQQYSGVVTRQGASGVVPFYGRTVATTWTVSLEPAVATLQQVDLTALTSIDLTVGYSAFM